MIFTGKKQSWIFLGFGLFLAFSLIIYSLIKTNRQSQETEKFILQQHWNLLHLSESFKRVMQLQWKIRENLYRTIPPEEILKYLSFVNIKIKDILISPDIDELISSSDISYLKEQQKLIENEIIPNLKFNNKKNLSSIIENLEIFTEKSSNIFSDSISNRHILQESIRKNQSNVSFLHNILILISVITIAILSIIGFLLLQKKKLVEERKEYFHSFSNLFAHATAPRIMIIRHLIEKLRITNELPGKKILDNAWNSIKQIEKITQDILMLTRPIPEHGVEELAELTKGVIQDNGNIVTIDMVPAVAKLGVPAAEIRLILDELLRNALDAVKTVENPEIIVRAHLDKTSDLQKKLLLSDRLILEVIDNGVGMTKKVKQASTDGLFSTKGDSHTGLGLSNCLKLVSNCGGTMKIETTPQKGTKIRIAFPIKITGELPSNSEQ